MNRAYILFQLNDALEQLQKTIHALKTDPEYDFGEYFVEMGHLYHHVNTAWNARDATDEQCRECAAVDFNRWQRFPKDEELQLDVGVDE